jgi:hypothetical protein
LRLCDVHPGEKRLFIADGKGGHQRIVPVSPRFFTSSRSRRGTTVHAMADGTRAVVDEPTIHGIPAWLLGGAGPYYPLVDEPVGPVLDGLFFPVL